MSRANFRHSAAFGFFFVLSLTAPASGNTWLPKNVYNTFRQEVWATGPNSNDGRPALSLTSKWDLFGRGISWPTHATRSTADGEPRHTSPDNTGANNSGGIGVFGSFPIAISSIALEKLIFPALHSMTGKSTREQCQTAICENEIPENWQPMLSKLQTLSLQSKIEWINYEVNRRLLYRTDAEMHGTADVWSTPAQTMKRMQGDCEDYVLVKMRLLAELEIPAEDLYIVVVESRRIKARHAVLAVKLGAEILILDNLSNRVRLEGSFQHYGAVFSANMKSTWLHAHPAPRQIAMLSKSEKNFVQRN